MNYRHREKRIAAWRYLMALPRSLWYNLRLLPWRQARRVPILISNRTVVEALSGRVTLEADNLRMGMVKIGFTTFQGSDYRRERTRLNIRGTLVFGGECNLGTGSSVEVAEEGVLTVGSMFNLGPRSLIVCHKEMTFGTFDRISWDCTLMDTDQHALVDCEGRRVNEDRPIAFGNNVWVGCHTIVTKGVHLADDTTVAAGSCVAGRHDEPMTVLAGNPATIVRRGVKREQK